MIEFNQDSPQHLSILLFGGSLEVSGKELIGEFKTGKKKGLEKFKNIKYEVKIEGLGLKPLNEWKTKKEGIYSTNEDILKVISKKQDSIAGQIADTILTIRGLQKELSTYYESTKELIYDCDSCIHPQFNNVASDTGRLSCKSPNAQNQPTPPSNVLKHFVSRFKSGIIISSDYKSIEPRVEAEDCKDKQLIQDIINEVDTHTKNLALAERVSYEEAEKKVKSGEWKDKRSKIKGFTFAQQYLASIKTTAKNSGLTEQEVEALMVERLKEYPRLHDWHRERYQEVEKNQYYTSCLGRRFYFKWKEGSFGGRYLSKNEIANYITQGTAFDIVSIMIGKFWREKAIYNRDKYLMINNVHDNLMLDCKEEYKSQAINDLKILEQWKEVAKEKFNLHWEVPIIISIKEGQSWYEAS